MGVSLQKKSIKIERKSRVQEFHILVVAYKHIYFYTLFYMRKKYLLFKLSNAYENIYEYRLLNMSTLIYEKSIRIFLPLSTP
jgi:hypothetical protein